jgi:hypothetical protein
MIIVVPVRQRPPFAHQSLHRRPEPHYHPDQGAQVKHRGENE